MTAMVSDVSPPSNSPVSAFIQHPTVFAWGLSVEDFVLWNWEVICSWEKQQATRNAVQYFKNVPLSFFMWLDLTSASAVTETPSARMALECGCLWLLYTDECVNTFFCLGVYCLSVVGSAVGQSCLLLSVQVSLSSTEFSGTFDFLSPLPTSQ